MTKIPTVFDAVLYGKLPAQQDNQPYVTSEVKNSTKTELEIEPEPTTWKA